MIHPALLALFVGAVCLFPQGVAAQELSRQRAIEVMRAASEYFHGKVSSHGGYVYHYSLDLSQRWGEGAATTDQIWVQPPGTPTVGMAYLSAFQATGDAFYRNAALDAGNALRYGQLKSGGWSSAIDFDPKGSQSGDYRNGRGRGKNYSTLDDGKSQSAIRFLARLDEATKFSNESIHESVQFALESMIGAQFSNGGFPQAWPGGQDSTESLKASYPAYDWRSEHRVKEYWFLCTLNDNLAGDVADTLIEAYRVYQNPKYLESLRRLGDFLVSAQMPAPQPGWAQQYTAEMKPAWARKFEPPAIASDETQEVIATLMLIAEATGESKYLAPIPAALDWLRESLLADGSLARYYELKSNRPLYMNRTGDQYWLTYDDSDLPSHYAWKIKSKLDSLSDAFNDAKARKPPVKPPSLRTLAKKAQPMVDSLDESKRWIDVIGQGRVVGQLRLPEGERYLSSETFSRNLTTLSEYVSRSAE